MFITSKDNPSALDPTARTMTWPGPRILLTSPDEQQSRQWIESAEVHYLVIDLVSPAAGRFDTLRIAITRMARARIEMSGPLLFCDKGIPDNEIVRLERTVWQDPWLIDATTNPVDGQLAMLVLGERIVTNPLFKSFFNNLHEGVTEMQTDGCIALMKEHLIWHEKGQTR